MIFCVIMDKEKNVVTALVTGVHGTNYDELKQIAQADFPDCAYVKMTQRQYNALLNKTDVDEEEANDEEAEKEKLLAEIEALKNSIKDTEKVTIDLLRQYVIADIKGDLELKEELKEEYISLTQIDFVEADEEETEE